jgi:hypothetical protein
MEFITEKEFEDIIVGKDVKLLNEVMERLFNKAVESAIQVTPGLTANLIKNAIALRSMSTKFLEDNKEFKDHEEILRNIVRQTELENPGATYEKVLEKSVPGIKAAIAAIDKIQPSELNRQ